MRFFRSVDIDFIGNRYKFFTISGLLLLLTVGAFIYRGGLNYGIDFTGGILMRISFQNEVGLQDVRIAVEESGINSFELQSSGNLVMIRIKKDLEAQEEFETLIKSSIQLRFPDNPVKIEGIEYIGPTVGEYLSKQAVYAFLFAFLVMIVYVAFRFKSSLWGIVSVVGIIHDIVISLGFVILANKEINITIVAALLTVVGYSINDTIVLFDRIKENLKLLVKEDFVAVINKSINEVLVRTIVTSLTVFIVACSLFFFGGEVMHTFAYIMIIGTVLGVFSTIFVCAPLICEWRIKTNKRLKIAIKQDGVRSK
ncbi:protein-export membrane protein SecF [Endomicrobiia bacterium]|uniref:Protein translocase subunit SecF n=1 Tax=Endomicrobium trichonymphae TaxID=1408204 RepID=SECF_ENDTX|nr:protein translocase subunit SecF [Candidatus Endomicrobium trichonymphae]B1H0M3.1 RecName: Full=Protein translocase subunit SecF [Candidatus Endomicrobium trichonymphae]GHT06677.1 protein-export membrane protein SecF [Endomicrobiia bacterium]BAG14055.1 protein translocase subunit SecF [Candidatus Endomicrobium trichonymphae]BAV59118.1 protein translocase subunit SecF [Candidatus Endomicrobium trichonymphae]GHT14080.1 protein-export membrane protein SecF [Endomicrobiia bacterium]GHT21558.1 